MKLAACLGAVALSAVAISIASAQVGDRLRTPGAKPFAVQKVFLSYMPSKETRCPRRILMRVGALTSGPGEVRFVVRKAGGGASTPLTAQAVRGSNGQYSATYNQQFTIDRNTTTKYMAEAVGTGKISPWIDFDERCGPQPRTNYGTRGAPTRPGRPLAEVDREPDKPMPGNSGKPMPGNAGKPMPDADGSRPSPGGGKRVCKSTVITSKRVAAKNQDFGIRTARVGWEYKARKDFGKAFDNFDLAQDKTQVCRGVGLYNCTVSGRPCHD